MADAEKLLKEARIRHLPVSNGKDIVGIISDRDIQRATSMVMNGNKEQTVIQHYKKVSEYMTSPVKKMRTQDTVEDLTREMIRMKISSFLIVDESDNAVGIITTEDLLVLLLDKLGTSAPKRFIQKLFSGLQD